MEDRWYTTAHGLGGNRQVVVADPDGYQLRFFEDLGGREDQVPSAKPSALALLSPGRTRLFASRDLSQLATHPEL